jgi:hypothetical protein
MLDDITPKPINKAKIIVKINSIKKKQKYDLAKFLRFTFLDPPNEKTKSNINPIIGIENNISYPKYPHIDIGLYSSGIFKLSSIINSLIYY